MRSQLRPAILLLLVMTIICGVAYPLAITGIAHVLFPHKAGGSLVVAHGRVIGSELIGQNFTRPEYFHPRPSAAGGGYDAAASSGSNLGPTSRALIGRADSIAKFLRQQNPAQAVPVELATASASGLDPHISPAAAAFQIPRVAAARGVPPQEVERRVARATEPRDFGILGESRINVLRLNQMLDAEVPKH